MFCLFKHGTQNFAEAQFELDIQVAVKNRTTTKIMNTFIWNRIVFMLVAAGATTLALADDSMSPTNQPLSTLTSQQFISDAAVGGMKEILLSEAALETSTNDDIKDFAKHMVKDHRAANKKLLKIAQEEGLTFPPTNTFLADDPNWSNPLIVDPASVKGSQLLTMPNLSYLTDYLDVKHLQSLTGREFDQVYLSDMVGDHIQAVKEFEMASQNLTDPEIRKFSVKTLPTLQKHSKMAQELNDKYSSVYANGTNTVNQPGLTVTPLSPM
jgi:putative membrane protein